MEIKKEMPNRLALEKSPYLLQHAHNPVQWFPWCADAFAKAKREDKPVFLSIGYSTCHWCHVMAHESFENAEAAEALNRDYIAVKVDREERPDIDAVYMAACQALTGAGGWPLTALLTPDQKPFYVATYLPRRSRYGQMGLMELLETAAKQWRDDRSRLLEAGDNIAAFVAQTRKHTPGQPNREMIHRAKNQLKQSFDPRWGGFGTAPKFPMAHNLLFLLRYSALERDHEAQSMAEHTLEQMARGGIFDQVGGGFSRYSTDGRWLVPHFEKMLYDNAQLISAYTEAWRLTRRPYYKTIAQRCIDYVLRELGNGHGGFVCGQDADSDGVEGKYYVFTPDELERVLGPGEGAWAARRFGVTHSGNFEGKSILNLIEHEAFEEWSPRLEQICLNLWEYRRERTRLHRDDKTLTAWNALMIAALAQAARAFGDAQYLDAAKNAQRFADRCLTRPDGRLYVRWREGEAAHDGQLEDYAFTALAQLELYQSSHDPCELGRAARTAQWMLELFEDGENGGFYLYSSQGEQLIARPKEVYDGAIPSGNSAAALALCRLAAVTGEERWRQACARQILWLAGADSADPAGHCLAMLAFLEELYPMRRLVCCAAENGGERPLIQALRERMPVNLAVLVKTPENAARLEQVAPDTADYPIPVHGAVYYLCENGACRAPSADLQLVLNQL